MTNPPLCQFGPGGDFVRPWPGSAKSVEQVLAVRAAAERAAAGRTQSRKDDDPGELTAAARLVIRVLTRSAEYHGSKPLTPQAEHQAAMRLAADLAAVDQTDPGVIRSGSAKVCDVAMPAGDPGRVTAGGAYAVVAENNEENIYGQDGPVNGDAETVGDTSADSGLSQSAWLFPDDAGARGPVGIDEGDGVRARRRVRKKRPARAWGQAQGALFTGIE